MFGEFLYSFELSLTTDRKSNQIGVMCSRDRTKQAVVGFRHDLIQRFMMSRLCIAFSAVLPPPAFRPFLWCHLVQLG